MSRPLPSEKITRPKTSLPASPKKSSSEKIKIVLGNDVICKNQADYSYDNHREWLLFLLKGRIYSSYALIYSPTGGTRNHSYVSLSALY
jgi:hypothetical protein